MSTTKTLKNLPEGLLPPDAVVVHVVGTGEGDETAARAVLDEAELARAARFRFARDAAEWVRGRAGLRRVLGGHLGVAATEVALAAGPHGKPCLAAPGTGLHFNLSHCPGLAVVAVCSAGPVGIDIEPLARAPSLLECEETFCHPRERAGLPADPAARALVLLEIWTAKESLLKAVGSGLLVPPDEVWVEGGRGWSGRGIDGLAELRVVVVEGDGLAGHRVAVAVPDGVARVVLAGDRQGA